MADGNNDDARRQQPEVTPFERLGQDMMASGVGYGRPPIYSQFQNGQSGNPKGRPRRAVSNSSFADQPTLDTVLKASSKRIGMREGERISEVPMFEALVQATFASALKGNAKAQSLAIGLIREAEQAKARWVADRNEVWSHYKEKTLHSLVEASKRGEPLPHPDDIVIDPADGPRFLGPVVECEEARMNETIAYCETLIMQDVLDERTAGYPAVETGSAMMLFHLLQKAIPPRLRLSTMEIAFRQERYLYWPKRKLLKEFYGAWRRLGKNVKRGAVMPSLGVTTKRLAFLLDITSVHDAGPIDLAAMER